MAQSKSSARWLRRQSNDYYVKQAQRQGWRSRAVTKLQQIDERYHLLYPEMRILDLGAAPGSWSQYFAARVRRGKIFAVDILPTKAIPGVFFVQSDIADARLSEQMISFFNHQKIDLVASDIAPNITGISSVDMPKILHLAELALEIASEMLERKGFFLVKVFQGRGFEEYLQQVKHCFIKVQTCKPAASRSTSKEVYILGKCLKSAG